jgi:hypothetical protein
MAFDINRLRTDQLQRLLEVGLDVNQLKTEELEDLLRSQEEVGDFGAGLSSLGAAAKLGFAGITGDKRLAESAQRTFEEIQLRRQPEVPSIIEAFEEEGLGAVGDIPTYVYEQLLFSAPQMAAQFGAGAIATRFGGPRAGMAAATAAGAPAAAGYNIQRQIEEQGIGIEDAQVAKAFAVGTGQAALDALLGRTIGVFGRTKGAEEIAKAAQRGMATRIARKAGEGAALEAVTESGQQVLEILQANPEKFFEFGPEIQRELAESAIAGGLLGGAIAAPAGIVRPRDIDADRQKDLEAHMQEEAEETLRMEEEAARFEQEQKLLEKRSFDLPERSPIFEKPRAPEVLEGEVLPPETPAESREVVSLPTQVIEQEPLAQRRRPEDGEGPPLPALPRGTGAIYVPPTAKQRGTLAGRLAGLTEVVEGVEQPSTARAEEAFRERIRAGMANPFNDQEAAKLLEKLNQLELEGKRKAAQNVRKRLEERLGGLGVNPEQTADLLAATPSQREQLKMFSQRAGAQAALDTRETAKKAYDSVTTSQFNQATERVRKALQRELRRLGLGDVALRMDNVVRPEPGTLAEGVTEQTAAGKVIIALSSKIYSPDMTDAQLKAKMGEVMNHEMIHAMKTLGLFTDAEYQSLVNAAREQKFVDKTGKERLFSYFDRAEKLYKNDLPEIKQEEAVAELFRDWAAGRRTIGGKPPTLFQKIIKFIKTLGGLLNKEGFDDPSKIFEAIQAGEIGRRERNTAKAVGIEDTQGTKRFSRQANVDQWLANSVVKNDVYHATLNTFPAFRTDRTDDGAVHFGLEPETGIERLGEIARFQIQQELEDGEVFFPRMITTKIKMENPLRLPFDMGNWGDWGLWRSALSKGSFQFTQGMPQARLRNYVLNDPTLQELYRRLSAIEESQREYYRKNPDSPDLIETDNFTGEEYRLSPDRLSPSDVIKPDTIWLELGDMGFDGIIYQNFGESDFGEESFLVWDADQIYVEAVEDIQYGDVPYMAQFDDPRESMSIEELARQARRPILGRQTQIADLDAFKSGDSQTRISMLSETLVGERGLEPIRQPARMMYSRKATADSPAFYSVTERQIEQLIGRYSYPLGTTGYAVRMPIEDFMSLTFSMGKIDKKNVITTAKEFLKNMPSNDGSVFTIDEDNNQYAAFDPEIVDSQNYMGVPFIDLEIDEEFGTIRAVGHEGRHRTSIAAIDGAETIPVQVRFKQFYTNYDTDRLFGNIPRDQRFNYYEFAKKREVEAQFKDYSPSARAKDSITYEVEIPAGVPIDYSFKEDLNRVIGPKSDPLGIAEESGTPEMGINVRYDAGSGIDYAEEIVSGRKTLETRNTDSLRPYVGQRVGIVRTGRGPAEAIGSVVIGEPVIADQAEFDRTRSQHLVPAGSTFDIKPGGTKFMYPVSSPEVFDQPVTVGRGIVARRLDSTADKRFSRRAMANPYNVNIDETIVPIYPGTENALNRKQGSVKKEVFAREMLERSGLTDLIPYNEDTQEQVARKMATEALMALEFDNNAIGWYDEKLRQAKNILNLVEPSIFENETNETTFDYALAVTSNGTAVMDNFPYALQAYRFYQENGRLPVAEWKQGGNRNKEMKRAFKFFNDYQTLYNEGQIDLPLSSFLDSQYQVRDLKKVIRDMRDKYNIKISVPSGEGANALIRGSLILGPKIGQGFYQNLRGNFNELTADQWWMRMWNRMVGNPFKPPPTKEVMQERRTKLRELIRAPEGPVEKQIIQQAFDRSGLRPSDLRSNKNLDEFSVEIRSRWNSYFRNFQKAEKRNPNKPKFFKFIDTYVGGLSDQLMDAPRGSAERQFMRDTTSRARELLAQEGVDINTADFQALLWYPEKRLWLSGGVAPGRGSDNDYADAAIETARQEGIANERIEEALADSGRVGISSGRYSRRAVPGTDQGTGQNAEKRGARDATRAVANSAGPNGQVWNVSRRSGTIREANVIASYRVAPEYESEYASGGVSTPEMFELEQSPKSAEAFETAITEATSGSPYAPAVYVYSREKYADMRLFLSGDSNSGFAVKGDDIVSVFNGPTSGLKNVTNSMLRLAFEQGGRRLDAFDTVLPDLYSNNLFKAIVRLPWDEKEAPNGWDKELFSRWKNGEPDVVFMAYDPTAKPYKDGDGEYASSYDEAVEIQQAAASRFSRRYSATAPSGQFNLDDMVDRLVSKEPETSPIMKIWDKFFLGRLEGETRWQAFTRNAVNRFLPGYLLDNYVNGEIADPANSVGRAMELSQSMTGRLWALAELGAMKFNPDTGTAEVIEAPDNIALRRIFEPIGEKYMRQFFAYAIAKRELKLGGQGRKGFKNLKEKDAVKIISESEAKYPFFREVHNNYALFNRRMVQMAVDSGLITKDQGDNFMNMDYVPYYRYAESATDPSEFSKAMAAKAHQSLKDPNVFEKELEGGTIPLGDMYENITKNAGLIVSASLKNYAMQKTADALDKASAMDGPKSWGRKAKEGETGQMITFYRNGEKVLYKIDDPALWTAVAGLTAKQKESFVKGLEMVGGILRAGVTIPPGFQLANLWRGKIDAYVKTGIPVYRFDQTVKAMRDVYANDKDTQRFKIITGMGGYLYGADAESLANTLKRGYRLKEPGGPIMQQIGDRLRQAYTALEKTGEASEMAERIVIMRKLMAEGVSEREAAFQGLNLINFGRRGAGGSPVMSYLVNFLIPTVTFLNARIQGLARLIEDPNTPGTVKAEAFKEIFARGMLVTAGSVTLGLLAMQDDRWEDESVIEKVTNDIIYIGDVKIRIPKAFEIGALFGTIPVMTLDAIRQERANDLAQAVGHIFVNTFSFSIVPQGLLPVLEVIGNYDSFRAAPIEGISLQRLPTELRAYESTPEIYKFLSRNGGSFIRLSPLEIQQLIEGYLGTMATNVIATTDTLLSATGAIPEKPSGVFGNPFVEFNRKYSWPEPVRSRGWCGCVTLCF